MRKISYPKWFEVAKSRLDPDDQVQGSYATRYGGNFGFIVASKRKLLFVIEKGFIFKTVNVIIELPYKEIDEATTENSNLVITDVGGKKYNFNTVYASLIKDNIRKLTETK